MSTSDSPSPRYSLRDFINRREPGARWMLLLLVLILVAELILLFCYEGDKPFGAEPAHYIPPIVTLAALLTCHWWSLPSAPAFPDPRYEVPRAAHRQVWLMAGAVAILAMWPRSARMDHSLSLTETEQLDTAYRYGRENAAPAEDDKIQPYGDRRLVWNHVAAQFAVTQLDQVPRHSAEFRALEPRTARALPWAASVLSAGLVVLLAAALGSPRAGLAAGLIAAMHPLFVQAGSEVADTALKQCFFGASLLCLLNALRTNAWRWWIALGATQTAMCFGDPPMYLTVFGMNFIAAAVLWRSPASTRDKTSHTFRLIAAGAISATTLAIPFSYVLTGFIQPPPLSEQLANGLSGVPFSIGDDLSAAGASLLGITNDAGWRWPVLFILLPLVIVAGVWFLLRYDWRTRIAGAGFLFFLLLLYSGAPLGSIPGLLLLPIVMAWAGVGLMQLFPKQPRLQHAPLFIAVIYVMATAPALQRTMGIPRQPLREVLAATYSKPASIMGTFGFGPIYLLKRDHAVHNLEKLEELDTLVDTAFANSQLLFVFHSLEDAAHARFESIIRKLETSGQFVLTHEFAAFDPRQNIRLYKYQSREQIIRLNLKPEKK